MKSSLTAIVITFLLILFINCYSQAESVNYVYDDLNRLTRVELADGTAIAYSYDEVGNRTQKYIQQSSCTTLPIKMGGTLYSVLQTTYDIATDGTVVQSMSVGFDENLDLNREVAVTLDGGYGCDYTTNQGYSTINGTLTITSGEVTVSNIVVR